MRLGTSQSEVISFLVKGDVLEADPTEIIPVTSCLLYKPGSYMANAGPLLLGITSAPY